MRDQRRMVSWFFAVAVSGLLIVATWWAFHSGLKKTEVRLADGRRVLFKGLTYGKNNRYISGNPLARTLVHIGATNWATQLGARVFSDPRLNRRMRGIQTNTDLLMAWIELRGTNVGANSLLPQTVATVLDTEGHESARNSFAAAMAAPGVAFFGFPITSFPRRDKTFVVKLWEVVKADFIPLAEFKVGNPARGSAENWVPEAFPIERHEGNELFALVGFNTGLSATGLVGQQNGSMFTEVLFRIGTNEPGFRGTNTRPREIANWSISSLELRDASGDFAGGESPPRGRIVWQTASNYSSSIADGVANVAGFLWTNEPAWKIRAQFSRSQPIPDELWTVRGITLPPPGTYREINLRTQIYDVPLVLKGITAADMPFPGERRPGLQDWPRIHVEFDSGTNTLDFSIRQAVDQHGSRIGHQRSASPRGEQAFSLRLSAETTALDLTFALRRNYVFEYLARPALLSTNVDHWTKRAAAPE